MGFCWSRSDRRKCFAVIVEKKDSETLNDIILKHVIPGSIVITDGWKGYNLFKTDFNYVHHWVNHSISFKNGDGFHTNTIEGTFNAMKMNIIPKYRNKKILNTNF